METSMVGGMCRCCASEGAFKDVKTCYSWMGEDEVYADMLKDCFDIHLGSSSSGQYGGICEVCITQLRNAANFKKQVQQTEEQFKQLESRFFSTSIVKIEAPPDEDTIIHHDSDDNMHDSIDETFSANECEIKSEVPEEKPKKRARATTSRAAKKAKVGDPDTTVKRVRRLVLTIREKPSLKLDSSCAKTVKRTKSLDIKGMSELEKHRHNIRMILQYSNATPIRCRGGIGYACSFCKEQFPEPSDLKDHTLTVHDNKTKLKFMHGKMMFSYLVKLDITSMKCSVCETAIDSLELMTDHLIKVHDKHMYTDIKNHILPFKFDDEVLRCIVCMNVFNKFKILQEHMNIHYRNHICDVCDAGFVNRHILANHTAVHKLGTFKCERCPKVFNTLRKQKSHEKSVHVHFNMLNKCGYCNQKFKDHRKKDEHLKKEHGVLPRTLKCQACDKTFVNKSSLTIHTKRDHLMERRYTCSLCDMTFYASNELRDHMVKHTGLRNFKCAVCYKAYGRKKTLREHMRIHEDDRRFKCEHCGTSFVQKCSWRGHMRNRHGEVV